MADDEEYPSYRIPFEEKERWLAHLKDEGYVVVGSVANESEVEKSRALFTSLFTDVFDVSFSDVSSWDSWHVDRRGISLDPRVMQSEGAWSVRGLPKVKESFATIWEEEDLIVSMDSVLMWKPWWANQQWLPMTEGLHVDQNPVKTPDFECVQGMLPLYNVTKEIGGLEVVPKSHLATPEFASRYPHISMYGNFVPLPKSHPARQKGKAKLLLAQAGDLILWESRTIHGGLVGTASTKNPPKDVELPRLARLTPTVCMLPRKRASAATLTQRLQGFEMGQGFNHNPAEANVTAFPRDSYVPIQLTEAQKALL
eukprot:CAMPEP_0201476972 /NCGR_PEP_ID=MMETSP0151_2-20130828/2102_1 /ASSEMBLY_ACC=CAM_ASM_000257 /TAXON_ID=200890 /ORGANISM="Paramoeba atlantica, Strain 621/1 / CCAP 1560/9" /LENGTH=311 /DNA_ID=CAMNT_0047857549 /DNA_START=67 /DNA_END=1002 /DNA_ORIENTATION=+